MWNNFKAEAPKVPNKTPHWDGEAPPTKGRFDIEILSVYYYPKNDSVCAAVVLKTSFVLEKDQKLSKYLRCYESRIAVISNDVYNDTHIRMCQMSYCRFCKKWQKWTSQTRNCGLPSPARRTCPSGLSYKRARIYCWPILRFTSWRRTHTFLPINPQRWKSNFDLVESCESSNCRSPNFMVSSTTLECVPETTTRVAGITTTTGQRSTLVWSKSS